MKTSKQFPKLMMVIRYGEKPGDSFCIEQTVELRGRIEMELKRDVVQANSSSQVKTTEPQGKRRQI